MPVNLPYAGPTGQLHAKMQKALDGWLATKPPRPAEPDPPFSSSLAKLALLYARGPVPEGLIKKCDQ